MADRLATLDDLPEEFADVPEAVRQRFLDLAAKFVSSVLGEDQSEAHWLRAAHWLRSAGLGGTSGSDGPVRAKQVGDVRVEFAVVSPGSVLGSDLGSTIYGRQLMALLRLYAGFGVMVA